ncbi:MAG: FAD-binding oxidoreductase [Rhodospirillales bacterium]
MTVPKQVLDAIRSVVGAKGWTADANEVEWHLVERRGLWRGTCAMVVSPANTEEVSRVVNICHDASVAVVPQGGNTGLVGGGVPEGGIALSLQRMKRIRNIDPVNFTLTAEAGCVLADVQKAAESADRLFPLSLGAEGSCQIGGNLSTNAGGVQVVRYGNARELVLGLEVVLPDGRVWDGLKGLRKDNTGYHLKHLFIGAEGTLGVITAAVLKLFPRPAWRETAFAAVPSAEAALKLFERARNDTADALTAFEFLSRRCMDIATRHVPGVTDPLREAHSFYALIELSGFGGADGRRRLREAMEALLAGALEAGIVLDATIAESAAQAKALWRIREAVPEAQSALGSSIKHDVAVPVSKVPQFLAEATPAVEKAVKGVRVVAFGHLGDGNLHFNLSQPEGADAKTFTGERERINHIVHDIAARLGGSFSAEHGIGKLKRDELRRYRSAEELALMRTLKCALDPRGIMNPGKVL